MNQIKTIYQDNDLLVADKPPQMITFREGQEEGEFLMDYLIKQYPSLKNTGEKPRYGAAHRLDKETSGIVLIAKSNDFFSYLQDQFKKREVYKEYIALCVGNIKEDGIIETHIGRSPRDRKKQKVYPLYNPKNPRLAITEYKVLKNFKNYTLIKVIPKTGRKHQIRCHMAHIGCPIAGDKMYGFKNQILPDNLNRHFLHAQFIKIKKEKEFKSFFSELPEDLDIVLKKIK